MRKRTKEEEGEGMWSRLQSWIEDELWGLSESEAWELDLGGG